MAGIARLMAGVAFGVMLVSNACASNLVADGDFSHGLTGWKSTATVGVASDADYISNAGASGSSGVSQYAAFGAANLVGGAIWQQLKTTVGQTYLFTFDYAGFGAASKQVLQWTIGDATARDAVKAKDLTTNLTDIFQQSYFVFTATSKNTLLKFSDHSPSSVNADMLLANVSVSAVPGPVVGAGLPALFAFLGLAGLIAHRRRKTACD